MQLLVYEVSIHRTVKLVGPGLGGEVKQAAGDLAILRREVAGLYRHLLKGFDGRSDHIGVQRIERPAGVLPFKTNGESSVRLPVDANVVPVCDIRSRNQ